MEKMKVVLVLLVFLLTISASFAMFKVRKYWSNVVSVGQEAKIACRLDRNILAQLFLD